MSARIVPLIDADEKQTLLAELATLKAERPYGWEDRATRIVDTLADNYDPFAIHEYNPEQTYAFKF